MASRRKPFIIEICGLKYRVLFRNEDTDPGMKGNWGYFNAETQTITLHPDNLETRALDTLVHEIMHAIFDAQGIETYLSTQLKKGCKVKEAEEQIIRLLTPALITSLRSAGLLSRKQIKP